MNVNGKTVMISRTDKIGDVILTLPMAGLLKARYPNCRVLFLGRAYTRPIIEASCHVDGFVDWEAADPNPLERSRWLSAFQPDILVHVFPVFAIARAAAKARIPIRIGTARRWFHWLWCNRRPFVRRHGSFLHEAVLNARLLQPLGIDTGPDPAAPAACYGLTRLPVLSERWRRAIDPERFNLVIHPLTRGSSAEWPLGHWTRLLKELAPDRFRIFLSAGPDQTALLKRTFAGIDGLVLLPPGQMPLAELLAFFRAADGLIAPSTGPLHMAAAVGTRVLGLHVGRPPIHPGRWGPLGKRAEVLTPPYPSDPLSALTPDRVVAVLNRWQTEKKRQRS